MTDRAELRALAAATQARVEAALPEAWRDGISYTVSSYQGRTVLVDRNMLDALLTRLEGAGASALALQLQVLADEALVAAGKCSGWRMSEDERQLRVRSDVLLRAAQELRR